MRRSSPRPVRVHRLSSCRRQSCRPNGQFDREKYQRFLSSPLAREQGILHAARDDVPRRDPAREALRAGRVDVYVTDDQLWNIWRDTHDSAQISWVDFTPGMIPDSSIHVSDAELQQYYGRTSRIRLGGPSDAVPSHDSANDRQGRYGCGAAPRGGAARLDRCTARRSPRWRRASPPTTASADERRIAGLGKAGTIRLRVRAARRGSSSPARSRSPC